MDCVEILKQMTDLFRNVTATADIVLMESTMPHDVPQWDSLLNIRYLLELEKHFKIRFSTQEIQEFGTVGNLCEIIHKRIANNGRQDS